MDMKDFIDQCRKEPKTIDFQQVMAVIDQYYAYTPSQFNNGAIDNPAGSNEGSCKVFAFAQLNNLSEMETLALFGQYYRDDVMGHPSGSDHNNIRNFLLDGWLGIRFDKVVLSKK